MKSCGAKRIRECNVSKIKNGLNMLKRAVKHGFKAKYVLVDSWFSSQNFIQTVRQLDNKQLHLNSVDVLVVNVFSNRIVCNKK